MLSYFFLFLVILSNFLIIPVVKEKIKVKLALAIPTGAPTTLADKMIQIPLLFALKTIKIMSMNPMHKYPHITKLFGCTWKMLAITF